ncbi:MAG: rubrerythrin family protein [Flavonifractor plautii]
MDIKGTRTEQNLWNAFSGESMARNKYLSFADKARQEGYAEVAELFERMAQNEGVHGKLMYQRLCGISWLRRTTFRGGDDRGIWEMDDGSIPAMPRPRPRGGLDEDRGAL